MPRRTALALLFAASLLAAPARVNQSDPRLAKAFRKPELNGWIFVHLEGTPSEIGFQHGYLLASEIEDAHKVIVLGLTHDSHKPYSFFRTAAEKVLWPRVEPQYREELKGIVEGLKARGVSLDLWDVVALNGWLELSPYYTGWYDKQHQLAALARPTPEHCSAFVAVGSYTRDGKVVIAHNNWTEYKEGSRWNIIFDIAPSEGYRILMDGMPGLIHSGDDFGVNSAGLAITETTIGHFAGFDPHGIPEFARARKAMQYAANIDDYARIMEDGNNGGYANTWLIADTHNNEIANLELGLKHVTLQRTKDGYFVGSNFPANPELIRDEASDYPVADLSISAQCAARPMGAADAREQGQDRRSGGAAISGGPLRYVLASDRAQRADIVRPYRSFDARVQSLAAGIRPGRHGAEQGRRCGDACRHVFHRGHGSRRWHRFQSCRPPERASAVRLGKKRVARSGFAPLDNVPGSPIGVCYLLKSARIVEVCATLTGEKRGQEKIGGRVPCVFESRSPRPLDCEAMRKDN